MRRAKRTIVIIGLALASCSGPVYVPSATPTTFHVRVLATTTTYPLLQDLVAGYTRPDVLFVVQSAALNWDTVYTQLVTGQYPFALTSFMPTDATLWVAPLGLDGIAIVVNAANPVPALSLDQLQLIFQGQVSHWTAVGGLELPITVISREPGADTHLAFETLVMDGQPLPFSGQLALSAKSVINLVDGQPGAVGYVSLSELEPRVRAVPLAAGPDQASVAITPETVQSGAYPLRTTLFIAGAAPPDNDSIYRDLFAWMQSEEGGHIIDRWQRGHLAPVLSATATP